MSTTYSISTSAPAGSSPFNRRRTLGRAPSPPIWACYEQIPYGDGYSDSDSEGSEEHSCSEDDEDYGEANTMDIDEAGDRTHHEKNAKDVKGKGRAVDPDAQPDTPSPQKSPKQERKKKHREPVINFRPILTIQKSQGFVWNQDLFVPPYIKDRYVASTSPPNAKGFISSSWASSTASSLHDYEVEVVEIRVKEGELDDIIP